MIAADRLNGIVLIEVTHPGGTSWHKGERVDVGTATVVSPILSNIYLSKLDTFAETVLIPHYGSSEADP